MIYYDPPYDAGEFAWVPGKSLDILPFKRTQGLDLDPTRPGTLWITNVDDYTIDLYDQTTETLIQRVGHLGNGNLLGEATGSIGIDAAGNLLAAIGVGDYDNDMLLLVKDDSGAIPVYEQTPPVRLFQMREKARSARDLADMVTGVAASDDQLIVSDRTLGSFPQGGRVLFWNRAIDKTLFESLSTYKPADGYLSGPGPEGPPTDFTMSIMPTDFEALA